MKIKNGLVFSAEDKMQKRDLNFENGVITENSENGEYDAEGCYVLPGFIDTHIHGVCGCSFSTPSESLKPSLDWLTMRGITSVMPTIATCSREDFINGLRNINLQNDDRIVGIHAEGPFLNIAYKGAMLEECIIPPSIKFFEELNAACDNNIKLITVAPEAEGAKEFAKYCISRGVAVSMGHTNATYEEAKEAAECGFTRMTHTYNAMRPLHHREPGVLGFALTCDKINSELICDFIHVAPAMINLAISAKGYENITVISDGEVVCGLADGDYLLGGHWLTVKDGVCKKKGTDTIAGSTRCLADGAKNLFSIGISPEKIAVMACVNPAKVCGCTDRGRLEIGYRADVIILDKEFNVIKVFLKGSAI